MPAENLYELFKQRVFRIPDYQRGYAWVDKQLTELWDDLDEISKEDGEYKHHYTGTIYLEESRPDAEEKWLSGVKFYNVVDGQQRLTTISILVFELLSGTEIGYCEETKDELLKNLIVKENASRSSRIYKFGYAKSSENTNYFMNKIMGDTTVVLRSDSQNLYTRNLENAKEFFRSRISKMSDEAKEALFKKVSTSLQFDIRLIEQDLDVQAVFETMNNRGKPLSTLEKLKNRLIYLTVKLPVPTEDRLNLRNKINDAWGQIYAHLAKNKDQVLDEDAFLSAHLSLYRKPKESTFSEHNSEEKVFQMFCNKSEKYYLNHLEESGEKEEAVTYKKIEKYVLSLAEMAPVWYNVHNTDLVLIKKILAQNSSKALKIFIAAILLKSKNGVATNQVIVDIERILFRNSIPGISVIDEGTIATRARSLYREEITVATMLEETKQILSIPVNADIVVNYFKTLFTYTNKPIGFHKWGNLKYFLFEYEERLHVHQTDTAKVDLDAFDETTIEHIIPQTFETHWKDIVQQVTGGLNDESKKQAEKVLINTLGNLTILKGGKNSALGNKSWEVKRERFRDGSFNEREIEKNPNWTKSEVRDRGDKMINFLEEKISGLNFSAEQKKLALFFDDTIIDLIGK